MPLDVAADWGVEESLAWLAESKLLEAVEPDIKLLPTNDVDEPRATTENITWQYWFAGVIVPHKIIDLAIIMPMVTNCFATKAIKGR